MDNSVTTTQLQPGKDSLRPDPKRAWGEIELIRQLHAALEAIPPENRRRTKLKVSVGDLSRLLYTVIGYCQFDLSHLMMNNTPADDFIRLVKAAHPDLTLQAGTLPPEAVSALPLLSGLAAQGSTPTLDDPHHIETLLRNTDVKPGGVRFVESQAQTVVSDVVTFDEPEDQALVTNPIPQVHSCFDHDCVYTVIIGDARFLKKQIGEGYPRHGLTNARVIDSTFSYTEWNRKRHQFDNDGVAYFYDTLIAQMIIDDLTLITQDELAFLLAFLDQPTFLQIATLPCATIDRAMLDAVYASLWTIRQIRSTGPRATTCTLIAGPHPVRQAYVLMKLPR